MVWCSTKVVSPPTGLRRAKGQPVHLGTCKWLRKSPLWVMAPEQLQVMSSPPGGSSAIASRLSCRYLSMCGAHTAALHRVYGFQTRCTQSRHLSTL